MKLFCRFAFLVLVVNPLFPPTLGARRRIQAEITDSALTIPQYYFAPIHAYEEGNLCWDSAMEVRIFSWSSLVDVGGILRFLFVVFPGYSYFQFLVLEVRVVFRSMEYWRNSLFTPSGRYMYFLPKV